MRTPRWKDFIGSRRAISESQDDQAAADRNGKTCHELTRNTGFASILPANLGFVIVNDGIEREQSQSSQARSD
jgi:hypothetical protein